MLRRLIAKLRSEAYWRKLRPFRGSEAYWRERYAHGGNSGVGSYGKFAQFKAEVLNDFVEEHHVGSVIEFGSGDGNQLTLARYPEYTGFDVSELTVQICRARFPQHRFELMSDYRSEQADLALSLDVIYHLVEDEAFDHYMRILFGAGRRFVVIYSSNHEAHGDAAHVRHRKFTDWTEANAAGWALARRIPNRYPFHGDYRTGSFADFYIFHRIISGSS